MGVGHRKPIRWVTYQQAERILTTIVKRRPRSTHCQLLRMLQRSNLCIRPFAQDGPCAHLERIPVILDVRNLSVPVPHALPGVGDRLLVNVSNLGARQCSLCGDVTIPQDRLDRAAQQMVERLQASLLLRRLEERIGNLETESIRREEPPSHSLQQDLAVRLVEVVEMLQQPRRIRKDIVRDRGGEITGVIETTEPIS